MALNPLDRIARDVAEVKRQLAGRSQLGHSSLENTAIPVYDGDGTERLRIGAQDDGTHAIKYVQGPPPPRPTAPVVSVDGPVVRVRWDGILMGGHIPEDFARIDVHFALASEDLESPDAVRANLATSAGNETVMAATQTGTYRVGLVAMSQSRARSEMSETVEVEVTLVNLEGALDSVVENARGGSNHYSPEPPSGTDHDPDRDLWFDTSVDDDGLTHYTPHRWDGTRWVSLEDERVQVIQDAQNDLASDIDGVRDSANGKNHVTWSTSSPPTQYAGVVDDVWFTMSGYGSGARVLSQWRWNGDVWVSTILSAAVLAQIDIGTGTFGELDGIRLKAGSVAADRLVVGILQNLVVDPRFKSAEINAARFRGVWTTVSAGDETWVRNAASDSSLDRQSFYLTTDGTAGNPDTRYAVQPGSKWRVSIEARIDDRNTSGISQLIASFVGYRADGTSRFMTANFTRDDNGQAAIEPDDQWHLMSAAYDWTEYSDVVAVAPRIFVLGGNGGSWVWFRNPFIGEQTGSTLIEDGAITTDKIAAGSITGESGILARLDAGVITYGEMEGARIKAGTIDTEQLAFGAATGDIVSADALNFKRGVGLDLVSSSFRAGDAVEITEEYGFRQFGPDGALNVDFPSDGSPASVRGDFSARRLSAQQLQLTGATTIASGADMVIESGVTAPTAAPQVTPYWDRVAMPPLADSESAAGLAWGDGHWWRLVTTTVGLSDGGRTRVEKINTAGQLVGGFDCAFRVSANGLTILGNEIYVLAAGLSLSGDGSTPTKPRMVVVYNLAGVEQRRWEYTSYGTGKYQPGIGTDGTDVVIAQCWKTGELTYRHYSPTGTLVAQHDTPAMVGADMTGFVSGDLDYGGFRTVFAVARASQVGWQFLTYTGTGAALTYQRADSWTTPGYHAPTGLAWDGTHLWSLDPDGNLVRYARKTVTGFVGDHADDWWMAVSWRNDPAETLVGPATRFTYPHRAQLLVTVPDTPQGVSGIAFFVAKGESAPTRTQLHWAQEINHVAQTSLLPSLASKWAMLRNPVGTSSFTDSEPGEIRSALSGFRVDGTGAGEWGPLRFGADGSLRGAGTIITGQVEHPSITAGNLNSYDVTITFPAGRFASPPVIMLSHTNGLVSPVPSAGTVTKDSFQLRVWNPHETRNAGAGTVYWAAIERST